MDEREILMLGREKEKNIRFVPILLMVYCALIPLEDILVASFGGSVNKYIGLAIMGLVALRLLAKKSLKLTLPKYMLLFVAFSLLSMVWCPVYNEVKTFSVMFNAFVYTIIVFQYPLNRREKDAVIFATFLGGFVVSVLMLSGGGFTQVSIVDSGRISFTTGGATADNNNLAISLSISIVAGLSLIYRRKPNRYFRILVIVGCIILSIAVFFTGSRGGLLALVVGLVAFVLLSDSGIKTRTVVLVAMCILVTVYILQNVLTAEIAARFSISSVLASGGTGRVEIWGKTYDLYRSASPLRWFVGYGYGSAPYLLQSYFGRARAVHNDVIQTLLELGIVGLSMYFFMWKEAFKNAFSRRYAAGFAFLVIIAVGSLSMELLIKKVLWNSFYLAIMCAPVSKNDSLGE